MSKRDHAPISDAGRTSPPDPDAIARRAYELFLQHGSVSGSEMDDWLQAEVELRALANGRHATEKVATATASDVVSGTARLTQAPKEAPPGGASEPRRGDGDRGGGRRGTRQQPSH